MIVTIPTDLPGWNYDSTFPRALADVVANSDSSWLQTIIDLGFSVALMLEAQSDDQLRTTVMKILIAQFQQVVDTGRLPGEVMQ